MSSKEKLLASAQKNLEKGQFVKAVKDFEELVALEPKVASHRQKLADALVRAQMPTGAVPHYEFVATSLSEAGFYLKAIAIYKQIQKIEPERSDIFLRLAELNEKQGLAGNACSEYKSLAVLYEKKGMTTEAVNILQKVADMEPGNILNKVRIAESYAKGGFKEKGREEFERLATELETHKSFDQLLKVYEFYVKLYPGVRSAQAGFARTLVLRGDAEKGMQLLRGLIKQSPDDLDVLNALASGYQALGDFENEHLTLQHMLKKRPDDLDDRERLIRSFLAGGDFARGMEELQKWGVQLLQSGRKDAVHAFCRHLQQELPSDAGKVAQLLEDLGLASAMAGAPGSAPIAAVPLHEGDFDLGSEFGGPSIAGASSTLAGEKLTPPSAGAALSAGPVVVVDATSELLPVGVNAGAPVPASPSAPPVILGAEESPLDFLEGFGAWSDADSGAVAAKPAPAVTPPRPPASPLVVPSPAAATPEVASAHPEMEFELDLGGELEASDSPTYAESGALSPPAELAPEFLDASTEISFPDNFTLDLSAAEVAAGTPEALSEDVTLPAGAAEFAAPLEIDLSLTEDVALVPELDLEPGSGEVAADIEEIEDLEELEHLEVPDHLEDLEELEVLEELDEVEPPSLAAAVTDSSGSEVMIDAAANIATEIDVSGYSFDAIEDAAQEISVDGGAQFLDVAASGLHEVDFDQSPAVAEDSKGSQESPTLAALVEPEVSPADSAAEEIGEFDLSAIAVDDAGIFQDTASTSFADVAPTEGPGFVELTAELEEVGFYLNQGLYTEAEQICRRLLEIDPDFSPALEKLAEVDSRRRSAAPAAEPADEDFLDLAAEILDDGALRATENLPGVEDLDRFRFDGVFSEFKKGIESQIDSGDTESHYNLGIAYKEMGLLDDAISEFAKAMSNPARRVDCLTLQGICLAEKGAFAQAEALFASGIGNSDLSEIERISLHYEMGLLYESWQRPADALTSFSTVAASDTVFRDVASKIKELQGRPEISGKSPAAETKPAKNRVSYV